MATFNKFNIFVQDIGQKVHNLNTDSLKFLLSNTSPNVADTVVDTTTPPYTIKSTSNAAEISNTNGYTAGGAALTAQGYTQTSGTGKLTGTGPVWTASGSMGPFRYVALYNNTGGATATRPVIGWWDYGSGVTLALNETFTVSVSGSGILTIA